jgi:hypothetical protein
MQGTGQQHPGQPSRGYRWDNITLTISNIYKGSCCKQCWDALRSRDVAELRQERGISVRIDETYIKVKQR